MKNFNKIAVLSFFGAQTLFAQKIDLDRQYWNLTYLNLPTQGKEVLDAKTFSVNFYADLANLGSIGMKPNYFDKNINMFGYEYTPTSGDFELEFEVGNFSKIREDVTSKSTEVRNNDNSVTTKITYLGYHTYICPTSIKILYKGNLLETKKFSTMLDAIEVTTAEFNDYRGASEELRKSGPKLYDRAREIYLFNFANEMGKFKQKFDFEVLKKEELFWQFDIKKAPEFSDFNEKLLEAKEIMTSKNVFDDIANTRKKMEPLLNYFKQGAAQYSSSDKKLRKTKYGYLINLARMQFWLEMYDDCEATCKQIIENDYDEKDGKAILADIKKVKEVFVKSGLNTRHFERPGFTQVEKFKMEQVTPKTEVSSFPKPPAGFKAFPGFLINYKKEKIVGQLWVKDIESSVCLTTSAGGRFMYDDNGKVKEFPIDVSNVDEMSFGRDYEFFRYVFKNSLGITENPYMFKVQHETENFRIVKYYKTNNEMKTKLNETIIEQRLFMNGGICIMNKKTGQIHPVSSLVAKNAKENTAEYYQGCPELKTKITNEEFGNLNQLDNQIKVLEFFESKCKK